MSSDITVVRPDAQDVGVIAKLVDEVERYYGGEAGGDGMARVELPRRLLFADRPAASVLLALSGGEVIGMASYSYLWPAAGDTPSLYLKELFVLEEHRGAGAATALVRRLEEIARAGGCSRIEWTVDRDNLGAQRLYEALGAAPQVDKILYRLPITERPRSEGF